MLPYNRPPPWKQPPSSRWRFALAFFPAHVENGMGCVIQAASHTRAAEVWHVP